jgi:hypothetical protein
MMSLHGQYSVLGVEVRSKGAYSDVAQVKVGPRTNMLSGIGSRPSGGNDTAVPRDNRLLFRFQLCMPTQAKTLAAPLSIDTPHALSVVKRLKIDITSYLASW